MRRLVCAACIVGLLASCSGQRADPVVAVGTTPPDPLPTAASTGIPEPGPPEIEAPSLAPSRAQANGGPPGPALPFRGAVDVPDRLLFFLVVGSDARPGQNATRARADSIHVAAVDPATRRGTVLGLPRDSYVEVPGYGRRKINSALPLGGPDLLVRTVRRLTGFPIEGYAVTGFAGFVSVVDELGGVDVYVSEPMNDRFSGASFERGWHHMDGRQALAYTRNRQVSGGDFTRSENQGSLVLHTLSKMRAETEDSSGIRRWLEILFRHASLDLSLEEAVRFGSLARSLDPAGMPNVVASGRSRTIGGQSVVVLDDAAYALFRDVGADAIADGRSEPVTPRPATPAPTPVPTPRPTPSPTPSAAATPVIPLS